MTWDTVKWSETDSVRVTQGLVGGQEEPKSESLLEAILARSRKHAFRRHVDGMNWKEGRIERANGLIECFETSLDSNRKALSLLKGVLRRKLLDSIRVARNNIVILGELASYCIPILDLLIPFHNVYGKHSEGGFRPVESTSQRPLD